jgi:hypothetical protein
LTPAASLRGGQVILEGFAGDQHTVQARQLHAWKVLAINELVNGGEA